ncbi:MAG: toxin-antitoxin system YwqK family antitoxin, partial [Crocinitomicaceae bacterium]
LIPVFVLVSCGKSEENTSEASSVESQEVKIENGVKTVYYKGTDKVRFQGNVNKDTLWDGKVTAYQPNGKIMSIHSYINGIKNGIFQVYRENGKLYYTGEWESENKIGSWYYYDSLGKFVKEVSYEKAYD